MTDCLFCKIINREIPADIVYEDDNVLAFRDIDPKAPTHILVVPKIHVSTFMNLDDDSVIVNLKNAAQKIAIKENIDKSGFRIVINTNKLAGQEVFHLHIHILGGRQMTWPPG